MITELQIKTLIKEISGLHGDPANIKTTRKLSELGFNDTMCIYLENRINELREPKEPLPAGSITPATTVKEVIDAAQK